MSTKSPRTEPCIKCDGSGHVSMRAALVTSFSQKEYTPLTCNHCGGKGMVCSTCHGCGFKDWPGPNGGVNPVTCPTCAGRTPVSGLQS